MKKQGKFKWFTMSSLSWGFLKAPALRCVPGLLFLTLYLDSLCPLVCVTGTFPFAETSLDHHPRFKSFPQTLLSGKS